VFKDGTGYGSGIVKDPNDAHEKAMKEAETDALKRALKDNGNPFGLALYDKAKENVLTEAQKRQIEQEEAEANFAAQLENEMAVRVAGIDDIDTLRALHGEQTDNIKYVGNYDRATRDRIVKLFTDRKADLLALQAKAEPETTPDPVDPTPPKSGKKQPAAKAEAASQAPSGAESEPSVTEPAAPPQAAIEEVRTGRTASEDSALSPELAVDYKDFGNPPNWVDWGKRCINVVREIGSRKTLDRWDAEHKDALAMLANLAVVGKRGKEPNQTDITGTEIADAIVLEIRRRHAKLAGANLTLRWADGSERDVFADPDDWVSALERFQNEMQFHNIAPNIEQAETLKADVGSAEFDARVDAVLDFHARAVERKRQAAA
jgi:hypothetical protein